MFFGIFLLPCAPRAVPGAVKLHLAAKSSLRLKPYNRLWISQAATFARNIPASLRSFAPARSSEREADNTVSAVVIAASVLGCNQCVRL
jgi:hypothetical protein